MCTIVLPSSRIKLFYFYNIWLVWKSPGKALDCGSFQKCAFDQVKAFSHKHNEKITYKRNFFMNEWIFAESIYKVKIFKLSFAGKHRESDGLEI
jgi:hypothetical protein